MLSQMDKLHGRIERWTVTRTGSWTVGKQAAGKLDTGMDRWTSNRWTAGHGGQAPGGDAGRGTFVGAGHPLQGRDVVVVLPHGEREHAHLFGA